MGLVFAIGLLSGLISSKTFTSTSAGATPQLVAISQLYLLVFLAILAGFFAKTLWDWLLALFKSILKVKTS